VSPVGKPPRAGKASVCRIVVLVTEEERAAIDAAVAERGQSMGELVRDGLILTGVLRRPERVDRSDLEPAFLVQTVRVLGPISAKAAETPSGGRARPSANKRPRGR
jgi:hypothetical protein